MKNSDKIPKEQTLRQKAEKFLKTKSSTKDIELSKSELLKLIHELDVHQIELEMQNDELLLAKIKAQNASNKYIELYDFAPSGFFTLNKDGEIIKLNLNGAKLLGKERSNLIKSNFGLFVSVGSRNVFNQFLDDVFSNKTKKSCEIELLTKDNSKLYIVLNGNISENDNECNLTTFNLTKRKKAENELLESKEFVMRLINSSEDCIKVLDLDGNLLSMNDGGQKLMEIDDISIYLNKSWTDFWKGEDNKAALNAISKAKTFGIGKFSGFCETEKGTPKWWEIVITPINDANGNLGSLLAISRDITEKRKSEEQLKKLSVAVEQSPSIIAITDLDGNIEYVNPRFTQVTDFTSEEVIAKNVNILRTDNYPNDHYKDLWVTISGGFIWRGEFHNKKKNGELYWESASVSPIYNDEGKITSYIKVAEDITERKKMEEELKEREKHLSSIIQNPVGYMIYRLKAGPDAMSPIITHVSPSITDLIGVSLEESKNYLKWFENVHPEDLPRLIEANQKGMKPPFLFEEEFRYNHPSKGLIWLHAKTNGIPYEHDAENIEWAHGILTDITERKKIEKDLRRSENELKKAQQITHIGSWYLDIQTNEVVWTEELYKMYGFDPALPLPPYTEHMKLFTPDSWELLSTSLDKTIETGIPYELELKTVRKDGSNGWMWVRGETEFNKEGKTIGLWGAAQDITERKFVEQELIIAKERAEESDRLKSAFLTNMSHEIRTPMNGILGFTTLLKEPNLSGEELHEYIDIIEKSGDRMLKTISNLMNISMIDAGQVKITSSDINLNEQIENLFSFFKPEVEQKGMNLKLQIDDEFDNAIINTDKEKFNSILTNLLKNAIKYSKKGSIEFGCNFKPDTEQPVLSPVTLSGVEVSKESRSAMLEFYVKDSGIGIPKNRQDAIFDRFVQADIEDREVYEGNGLGLSITKAYVEMLGGEIWLESEEGKGSVFYFTIPCTEINTTVSKDQKALPKSDIQESKFKILIAEDEEVSDLHLSILLKNIGKEIFHTKNGLEAIEICRNNPDIDLILMDIKMPKMSGYEATRQIRKFNKNVIIIAQTAYALEGDKEKAIEAGCDDYVSKPIDKDELFEKIGRLVKK